MKTKAILILLCLMMLFPAAAQTGENLVLPQLYISEVLSTNSLYPIEGRLADFIELHNAGDTAIDLSGMGITDSAARPFKTRLDGQLKPGEYLVLASDDMGLGFALAKEGETITLFSADGEKLDQVTYQDMQKDESLIRVDKGQFERTWAVTPGSENTLLSKDDMEKARYERARAKGLVISEVLASDIAYEFGKPNADWVELQNISTESINLKGFYLSDDALDLQKYALPKLTLKPGQLIQIYCYMGEDKEKLRSKYINTAFEIERTNGSLVLSDGKEVIDAVSLTTQFGGINYGRLEGQGVFRYFETPTPQKTNPAKGSINRLDKVEYSLTGGFLSEAFNLELKAAPGSHIRYTTNGDEPTSKSAVYQSPIFIDKNTVIRAKAYQDGWVSSLTATQTYLFEEAPQGIPVVCLAGEKAIFFGSKGLFEEGNEELTTERILNVEMYDAEHDQAVNQVSGIRLTGGSSKVYIPRTFTLYARSKLEKEHFAINPFSDRTYNEYDALTLRHGGTDTRRTRIKDAFLTRLANGFGVMYLASAPAQVYVNGEYWGAFNFRERSNQDAIAQWEGLNDPDLIDQIDIIKNRGTQQKGGKADLEALAEYCRSHDLNNPASLKHVTDRLDVRSLFAHTAMEIISGNTDLSNVRYYRLPGGKWKLMLFDLDLSMYHNNREPIDFYLRSGRYATRHNYGELFNALMEVPSMRTEFLTLIGRMMAQRFSPDYIKTTMDKWRALYIPVLEKHFSKWKELSMARWVSEMDKFEKYLVLRPKSVMNWLIDAYNLSEQDITTYFGDYQKALEQASN